MIPVALEPPPHVVAASVGDVDGDGREELIWVSHIPQGQGPDAVKLTLLSLDDRGGVSKRRVVDLGSEPAVWDVWGGLWVLDGEGVVRLDPDTGARERVISLPTPLRGLGPATPIKGRVARDLGHDGSPELFVHSGGHYHVFAADGTPLGAVRAPARGQLSERTEQGGQHLQASQEPPPLVFADVDGDGVEDLVLPQGEQLLVHFGSETAITRKARLASPVDLEPREDLQPRKGETRRRITRTFLQDFDGDGHMDLGLHRMVVSGSWFGTTAELVLARGTGSGFAAPQVLQLDTASFFALTLDFDGDGDTDLLVPQMDTGFTSLGRALVSKNLPVDLDLFTLEGGALSADPLTLLEVSQQVEGGDGPEWVFSDGSDVDGDGRPDLVRFDPEEGLQVYWSQDLAEQGDPGLTVPARLPEAGELLVHDLTGDGRAEVVLWAKRASEGTLLIGRWPQSSSGALD